LRDVRKNSKQNAFYEHYEQVLLDSVAIIAIENAGTVENKGYAYLTVI